MLPSCRAPQPYVERFHPKHPPHSHRGPRLPEAFANLLSWPLQPQHVAHCKRKRLQDQQEDLGCLWARDPSSSPTARPSERRGPGRRCEAHGTRMEGRSLLRALSLQQAASAHGNDQALRPPSRDWTHQDLPTELERMALHSSRRCSFWPTNRWKKQGVLHSRSRKRH
eukprot:Skav222636  [mRNA]  locus=scaffold10:225337:225840:- [translate_table: standard]